MQEYGIVTQEARGYKNWDICFPKLFPNCTEW